MREKELVNFIFLYFRQSFRLLSGLGLVLARCIVAIPTGWLEVDSCK